MIPRWATFYAVIRRIPRGRVTTYGEVALLAGWPGAARLVGHALAALRGTRHRIPWHRVLGRRDRAHAGISILDPMGAAVQRDLLEREGVALDARGRVELATYGWRASSRGRVRTRPSPASPPRSRRRTPGSSGRS